jgi:pimeloyl-ACP methyl ester carboxylesterase
VQPEIAKITRTFSYDRAGLGISDLSPLKWSSQSEVYELHTLLEEAKVKAPYIIVAHSIGGFNARLFAGTYPKEVIGIVFVDSTNEIIGDRLKSFPLEELDIKYKFFITSSEQVKQARQKDVLRDIPIIVLSADQKGTDLPEEGKEDLKWQQDDIASLSNESEHIFVKDSSHYIQTDQPRVVIDAIIRLIDIVRNEKKS